MKVMQYTVKAALVVLLLLLAWGGGQTAPTPSVCASSPEAQAEGPAGWDCLKVLDPVVLKDGSTYKMWYTGLGLDDEARIGYATSNDGITWTKYADNPVLGLGPSGSWDDSWVRVNTVLKDGDTYKMWYTSGGEVGYATSADGIHWTKYSHNPVLKEGSPGAWDRWIVHIYVLKDGSTYKMWYSGVSDTSPRVFRIGYATSSDGITWSKRPNPVLDVGPAGSWEAQGVFDPSVIKAGDPPYRMWYSGIDKPFSESNVTLRIGYATSSDGITWTKHSGNPVLNVDPSGWDSQSVTAPWVLYDGSTYSMWYHGGVPGGTVPEMIGYATSNDGITWTKYSGNPVLQPTECEHVYLPVIRRN